MVILANNICRYFFIKPELADKNFIDTTSQRFVQYEDIDIPSCIDQWCCKVNDSCCKIYNSVKSGFVVSNFKVSNTLVSNNNFYININNNLSKYATNLDAYATNIYYKISFELKLDILENQTNADSQCTTTMSVNDNDSCVAIDIGTTQDNQFELNLKQIKKVNINGLEYDLNTQNPFIKIKSFASYFDINDNATYQLIQDNIRVSVYIPICYKNVWFDEVSKSEALQRLDNSNYDIVITDRGNSLGVNSGYHGIFRDHTSPMPAFMYRQHEYYGYVFPSNNKNMIIDYQYLCCEYKYRDMFILEYKPTCADCVDCVNCFRCKNLKQCVDCFNCLDSNYCHNCHNCSSIHGCGHIQR